MDKTKQMKQSAVLEQRNHKCQVASIGGPVVYVFLCRERKLASGSWGSLPLVADPSLRADLEKAEKKKKVL